MSLIYVKMPCFFRQFSQKEKTAVAYGHIGRKPRRVQPLSETKFTRSPLSKTEAPASSRLCEDTGASVHCGNAKGSGVLRLLGRLALCDLHLAALTPKTIVRALGRRRTGKKGIRPHCLLRIELIALGFC